MSKDSINKGQGHYIYRAWITDKNGNRIYAKTYGKKAFRIWVPDKESA